MLNKHGLKLHGLNKAHAMIQDIYSGSDVFVTLYYNLETGYIIAEEHSDDGYVDYDYPIVHVCDIYEPLTKQEIIDKIYCNCIAYML